MPLQPGTTLGPYEILSPIGAGGMGEVYKARDTRLGRTVAIKVLPEHVAADPDLKQRFEREAKTISSLNHPHICTLYDIGSQDGIDFLVMEYLEGDTLAQRLEQGALPLDQALQVAIEIADALDKAHRQGITHRDLKPGNIMLTTAGAKLLDFGLAKLKPSHNAPVGVSAPTVSAGLTGEGAILGTLQYMAPEQLEGKEADHRTDIFAFGALVYEMVTGRKAFSGQSQASLISAIMTSSPPSLASLQPLSPVGLDRVVTTCLAKDPEERWQAARDITHELRWIAASDVQASQPASRAPAAQTTGQRRAMSLATVAIGSALVVGLGVWTVMRTAPTTPRATVRFGLVPPATEPLNISADSRDLAVSPDGQRIAYLAVGGLEHEVRVRELNQLTPTTLVAEGEPYDLFFSPDGQWVGFVDLANTSIKRVSVEGGPALTISESLGALRGASWGEDGMIVFAANRQRGLFRVAASGGDPEPLTTPDDEAHRWPYRLPRGDAVLFVIRRQGQNQIAVLSLETGEQKVLVNGGSHPRYASSGHLVYADGNSLWAVRFDPERLETVGDHFSVLDGVLTKGSGATNYSFSRNGTLAYVPRAAVLRTLVWVHRQGREEPTGASPRAYNMLQISPDGGQVIVDVLETDTGDLWLLDLERQVEEKFTFFPGLDRWPLWSKDGSQIIFTSSRSGSGMELHAKAADGTGSVQRLVQNKLGGHVAYGWSADGETLVLMQIDPATGYDIATLDLRDASEVRKLINTDARDTLPAVSPDGRWIAYQSFESGVGEVYVRPFPDVSSGASHLISVGGGTEPLWGRDGQELFYRNGEVVMAVSVNTGAIFERDTPRPLFSRPYYLGLGRTWDISPDGQQFLMVKSVAATDDTTASGQITVVLNWFEELKARVPTN